MNKPTLYEHISIIVPGSSLVFDLIFFFPELRFLLANDGMSLGELGIFLLLSYGGGHLIAAVGNAGEALLWRLAGGMPSDWLVRDESGLISLQQRDHVQAKLQSRLGITVESISGLDQKDWRPIACQIYADVAKNGKPDRIDAFNGNYGLNRGLAAACFLLSAVGALSMMWFSALLLLAFLPSTPSEDTVLASLTRGSYISSS